MKKYKYIMLSLVLAGAFGSCSKDDPFGSAESSATGQLLTSSLDVSLMNENGPRDIRNRKVRMAAPAPDEFKVDFYRDGLSTPETTFLYASMPEVVTLRVGEYTAVATYGTNPVADWDSPYYEGKTTFTIVEDMITDNVEPIICKISNVRVSVSFSDELREALSNDWVVTVKVGEEGSLDFTTATDGKSGFFRYDEGSHTLAAEFAGTVDGVMSKAALTAINVEAGKHYDIRFKMYDAGEEDPGFVIPTPGHDGVVNVDSDVTSEDMNVDIDSDIPTIDEGNGRPQEGEETPKEDPENPGQDDPVGNAPTITAQAPYDINGVNELDEDSPVVLDIHSSADSGIKEFTVKIVSNTLTKDILEEVELSDEFDMINPGKFEQKLRDLGFPVNVGGQKDVQFIITSQFIQMMSMLGEGNHQFILTVTDDNGTTVKTLKVHNY